VLAGYGQRAHTRSDHVRLVAGYLGWKRYPIMLALVAQSAADQLDKVVALFDGPVSGRR